MYFVNVERGNIADKLQPRNINISLNLCGLEDGCHEARPLTLLLAVPSLCVQESVG